MIKDEKNIVLQQKYFIVKMYGLYNLNTELQDKLKDRVREYQR